MTRKLQKAVTLVTVVLCLLANTVSAQSPQSILLLKSNDNHFFNRSIDILINKVKDYRFNISSIENFTSNPQQFSDYSLVITFGKQAASQEFKSGQKVLHSYITENELQPQQHHDALLLEQPLKRYLRFVQILSPASRVAVIPTTANKIPAEQLLNFENTISLRQYPSDETSNPLNLVRRALRENDLLLCLPNPEVYNQRSLKGILLTAYRYKKPVISYSPSMVHSGALAAIYSTPEQIGSRLAELVSQLGSKSYTEKKLIFHNSEFVIKFNQQVAEALDVQLPDEQEAVAQIKKMEAE